MHTNSAMAEFKRGVDIESAPTGSTGEAKLQRSLLWKLDIRIIPSLTLLFLLSFIDRKSTVLRYKFYHHLSRSWLLLFLASIVGTNIGNAKVLGLEEDLNLTNHEYQVSLAVFYAAYIVVEIPSNLVLKAMTPRVWLPLLTSLFGFISIGLGFVKDFQGLVVARTFLGVVEGGLLPGIVLFLNFCYKRQEMALRMGLIYSATSLSGAFGGLLARGLNAIGPARGIEGWRWIFIVEGIITAILAAATYFVLPNSLESASFLTSEEKAFARHRIEAEKPKPALDEHGEPVPEKFEWSEVMRGIFDIRTWLSAVAYFAIICGLYSFGLFLPTIVNNLGYGEDPNRAQLFTVPPYAVACVLTVVVAFISDRLRLRGVIMLFTLPIAIAGYALIAYTDRDNVRYGATFIMAIGQYCSVPCILVWLSTNSAGHYKRATTSALQLMVANCGGFVTTFIYPNSGAPAFRKSHVTILGLLCAAWLLIFIKVLYCHWLNKRKAGGTSKYEAYRGKINDDRNPDFKLTL